MPYVLVRESYVQGRYVGEFLAASLPWDTPHVCPHARDKDKSQLVDVMKYKQRDCVRPVHRARREARRDNWEHTCV